MQDLIGQKVNFQSQPYHSGELTITGYECLCEQYGLYLLTGDAVCSETSRLFQHTSVRQRTISGHRIYRFTEEQIREAIATGRALIHVYPV